MTWHYGIIKYENREGDGVPYYGLAEVFEDEGDGLSWTDGPTTFVGDDKAGVIWALKQALKDAKKYKVIKEKKVRKSKELKEAMLAVGNP